ncbi:MAG: 2-hydroxyacyl-CoA dehydratase family protein [Syntrophales bacterium]
MYKTKRLDCWPKGKELREKFWENVWKGKERGKTVGCTYATLSMSFMSGFPDCEFAELGNYFAMIATKPDMAVRFAEACENKGYLIDICHASQLIMGSMFLDEGPFGKFLKPDFCVQLHYCETQGKASQVMSQHLGVPYFCMDYPLVRWGEVKDYHVNFVISELSAFIEWMEKLTGKKCDDEKLIEGVQNEGETSVLWAKICELNKNIPAPLDQRALGSLSGPALLGNNKKETVEFYRELYDEVQDRVKNQIAHLATERCRLIHEGVPPYYFLSFFRIVEKYGALFVGSSMDFGITGNWKRDSNGSWRAGDGLKERGIELKSREDALRAIAWLWLDNPFFSGFLGAPKIEEIVARVKDWHADGVVFHCDRGCQALPSGMPEMRSALQKEGIPSMIYEASHGDPREMDESRVTGRLESFMETLGLDVIGNS